MRMCLLDPQLFVSHNLSPNTPSQSRISSTTVARPTSVRLPQKLETILKERKDVHRKGNMGMVAEHTWDTQHTIQWDETTFLAWRYIELRIKEALHILMTLYLGSSTLALPPVCMYPSDTKL